jgi:hypothetical protein
MSIGWGGRTRGGPLGVAVGGDPAAVTRVVARAGRARATRGWGKGQPVLTAVSSTTNEVCSETSSVPVNLRVTVWPAKLPSE